MMTKMMIYLYDRFFETNRNFTTEHVKVVKTRGFSRLFSLFKIPGFSVQNFRFFSNFVKFQVFPGKVATL